MSDKKKTDWSLVNKALKDEKKTELPEVFEGDKGLPMKQKAELALQSFDGLIARARARHQEKKMNYQILKYYYEKNLDIAEEYMDQAVRAKKKEIMVEAQRFRYELDSRLMNYANEFGLKNIKQLMMTMTKLDEQTAEQIRAYQVKDIPEKMKIETIKGMTKLRKDFLDKLLKQMEQFESD